MADKCDPIRSEIRVLREQLAKIPRTEKGPKGKPVPNEAFVEKEREIRTANGRLTKCVDTLPKSPPSPPPAPPPPPPPVPVTLTLTKFDCRDQSDDISILGQNVEDDEPYAVVWAVDLKLKNLVPAGATNSKMTLVGPLADVDLEILSAPPNVIWGLSNAPDFITSADNLIVLVAMMENDTGSPEAVRTALEAAARVALVANLTAFVNNQIPRQELVDRIISGMDGAVKAAKVGIPDPDDNIGLIQELRFFQPELEAIYKNVGPVTKFLGFEGDDARYILTFQMFR
jgi:hypothetical protein